ncbi:MAG: hypothetical protein ACM34I_03095 [bacterium]
MNKDQTPVIHTGKILTYRFYDVAYEIELHKVEEKLQKETKRIRIERKPFSKAFEFANPPVSFTLGQIDKEIDGIKIPFTVHCKAFDYGVLSIILEVALADVSFPDLKNLALSLDGSDEIDAECRTQMRQVLTLIGDSFVGFNVSHFEEDYTIFYIESLAPGLSVDSFLDTHDIAGLMLYEEPPLSGRTKSELMASRFSYYENDAVILNFDNALVIEPSGSLEIADILEFANAQLLELRYYDHIIDRELDYINSVSLRMGFSVWNIKKYETLAAKFMKTITELTDITEKIDNSLKVTEDVYFAKVYSSALKLFRVREWESGIRRKLDLAFRGYDMLYKEIATKRTELIEIIIALLIILEILLFFLVK